MDWPPPEILELLIESSIELGVVACHGCGAIIEPHASNPEGLVVILCDEHQLIHVVHDHCVAPETLEFIRVLQDKAIKYAKAGLN